MVRTLSLVGLVLAFFAFGCGGPPKQALEPTKSGDEAPASDSPPADGTSPDPSGKSAAADSSGDTTGPVTCTANTVCTELPFSGKEASDAKDRCKAAGGEPKDGVCSHDDVAATCAVEAKKITMYFYVDKTKNKEWMKGFLKGGEDACTEAGGTMTRTAAAKGGGGGGGKGGGKGGGGKKGGKPKKK